ncbi:MAG: hypothetical protein WA268_20525 [Xanthobacteraceae bacterium]
MQQRNHVGDTLRQFAQQFGGLAHMQHVCVSGCVGVAELAHSGVERVAQRCLDVPFVQHKGDVGDALNRVRAFGCGATRREQRLDAFYGRRNAGEFVGGFGHDLRRARGKARVVALKYSADGVGGHFCNHSCASRRPASIATQRAAGIKGSNARNG